MTNFVVVIAGRPNVGKSALFNRLCGRRRAIVEKQSGITRDRIAQAIEWRGRCFTLIDTGGIEQAGASKITAAVIRQVRRALSEADAVIFVVDAKAGVTAADKNAADFLRRVMQNAPDKKVIVAVNKADSREEIESESEFFELGIAPVVCVSALHGLNIDTLLDTIIRSTGNSAVFTQQHQQEKPPLALAIIGRPNAGKSTLFNALLKQERAIVDEQPGTTRDSIDTDLLLEGRHYRLIDTAGMRRRKKTSDNIGIYSRVRTLRAIERSDVCIVLLDALKGILRDDLHVFSLIKERERGCVIAVNKCDAVKLTQTLCAQTIARRAPFMSFAPVLLISAKTGEGLYRLLPAAEEVRRNCLRKIHQKELSDFLKKTLERNPRLVCGGRLKFNYLTQVRAAPPVFVLIVNNPALWRNNFTGYLENELRKRYDFSGTPLKIIVKRKK